MQELEHSLEAIIPFLHRKKQEPTNYSNTGTLYQLQTIESVSDALLMLYQKF
jgi:hypothetical protein